MDREFASMSESGQSYQIKSNWRQMAHRQLRQNKVLIPYLLFDQAPRVIKHLDVQRHLADRMGRTAQAWIVEPDPVFDTVHHAFGDLGLAGHIRLGDLLNGLIDCPVVVAGGDDQIDLC